MADSTADKCSASEGDSVQDPEDQCCCDLYSNFLNPMSVPLRQDTRNFMHELMKGDTEDNGDQEKCQQLILRIEAELGHGHMICEHITKLMAERLRKLNLLDDAINLVKGRTERLSTEDFGSLITLSRLYNLSGDYFKSLSPLEKALQIANKDGDPVRKCQALAKLSSVHWHLQNTGEVEKKLSLCLSTLEDCDMTQKEIESPLSDDARRLIDIYKTIGYIYRVRKDFASGAEYYSKALKIVEKDEKAVIQMLKLETQIGCEFSLGNSNYEMKEYCLKAYKRIKELSKNEVFMRHHPLTVIHSLARVAHSLEMAERNIEVLEIRENLCNIGEKYLTDNHPELARLAADCAYLCNYLHMTYKEADYIEKASAVLEHNATQTDVKFLKTNVRELSDAWTMLGKLYLNRDQFQKSEKCFKMAVAVNTRVYGSNHPRLGRLHLSMGYLYKRFDKFPESAESFRKCKEITEEFNPDNKALLGKLSKELRVVSNLERKKFGFGNS